MIQTIASFPIYVTPNLADQKKFYEQTFGLASVFYEESFYLHMVNPATGNQLAFMCPEHPSQPEILHQSVNAAGHVISFEVEDAQSAWRLAQKMELKVELGLTEESWGQRHFLIRDPADFVVDIVEHLSSSS
ncbi:MAG: VOC family protein [Pseudomonadota bacterium]